MFIYRAHPSLQDTRKLVADLHKGQYYGKRDYTYHLYQVTRRVSVLLDDPMMLHAALLHDAIEDCRNFDHRSMKRLGYRRKIIKSVQDLTKPGERGRPLLPESWRGEKDLGQISAHLFFKRCNYEDYIDSLLGSSVDLDTQRIKYADLCENIENSRAQVEYIRSSPEDIEPADIIGLLAYWEGRVEIYKNAIRVLRREIPFLKAMERQNPLLEV